LTGETLTDEAAEQLFARAVAGEPATSLERSAWTFRLLLEFGRWDAEAGWTKQLHLGVLRNTNLRGYARVGPDAGYDSIGDYRHADGLRRLLDTLDSECHLPQMVLYNVNPSDNYVIATMAGNYQEGGRPGKVQFGSGWWYLDEKEGIEWQINTLSKVGLLRRFVGMLTDSRSFMSYPRHEYFRRVLCNLLGRDMEQGLLPDDFELVGQMAREICFDNARRFFGLELDSQP
jgi:glucuronate isomerase